MQYLASFELKRFFSNSMSATVSNIFDPAVGVARFRG
jgi:hypothetical protein